MSDLKSLLFRDDQDSTIRRSGDLFDCKVDTPSKAQTEAPEDQDSGSSENFKSLTYVSSRGFFFH